MFQEQDATVQAVTMTIFLGSVASPPRLAAADIRTFGVVASGVCVTVMSIS